MTEEAQSKSSGLSKARRIARSFRRHLFNYVFIAIAGSVCIMAVSTLAKAYWVKRPLEKASSCLADNKIDELLSAIDRTSRWESLYPSLKPRRDTIAIRCHARKNEIGKAMGIADAMVNSSFNSPSFLDFLRGFIPPDSVDTIVDRFSYFINHMEKPLAALVNAKFQKQNIQLGINGWSGYTCLTEELKAANNKDGLAKVLNTCRKFHADSPFTADLARFIEGVTQAKKEIPHPDAEAPIGWGMVSKEEISVFDGSGKFLTKATAGTIVEVDEIRESKSGEIVIGSLRYRSSEKPGVVVLAKDLALKRGLLFEVDAGILEKLYTRAELTQKIAEAMESASAAAASANPHANEYTKLADEYKALWSEINDLTAKFNSNTGVEREKYGDKLRLLKPRSVTINNDIKDVKAKYEAWAKANGNGKVTSAEADNLRIQLRQVEAELRELNYL